MSYYSHNINLYKFNYSLTDLFNLVGKNNKIKQRTHLISDMQIWSMKDELKESHTKLTRLFIMCWFFFYNSNCPTNTTYNSSIAYQCLLAVLTLLTSWQYHACITYHIITWLIYDTNSAYNTNITYETSITFFTKNYIPKTDYGVQLEPLIIIITH